MTFEQRLRELNAKIKEANATRSTGMLLHFMFERRELLVNHATQIADFVEAAREVITISDRKHDAWDAAKRALAALDKGET